MKNPRKIKFFLRISSLVLFVFVLLSIVHPMFVYGIPFIAIVNNVYLWHHASDITGLKKDNRKNDVYRSMVFLCVFVVVLVFLTLFLSLKEEYRIIASDIRYFVIMFFVCMFGNNAPKIPYNHTLGLRISWVIRREATYRYAHRMIGYCSIPCVIWMLIAYFMHQPAYGYLGILVFMVILPSLLSYTFDQKQETLEEQQSKLIWIIPIFIVMISILLYPNLPSEFPMQFHMNMEVNETAPKIYALSILIGIDLLLLFYYHKATKLKQWIIQSLFFLFFLVLLSFVLIQYASF